VRAREKKKGEVYWARYQAKKRHASGRQAAAGGQRRAWRLKRALARCICARRIQRGRLSGGRASWGPGGTGRAAKRQLATGENVGHGRWVALQKNEEEDEDLFINFAKVQGDHSKIFFQTIALMKICPKSKV
jgi:hypothetical protein